MSQSNKDTDKILNILKDQEKRIIRLENKIGIVGDMKTFNSDLKEDHVEIKKHTIHREHHSAPNIPKFTFNQAITFLGISGIIVGLISFFFYAIARGWIGETFQVLIGVFIGLGLFATGYKLINKNREWALIVIGGALFIEFLSIGIGILEYEVIPKSIGFILLFVFLIISTILSLKFKSRIIAYYTLVGGYMIPFICDYYDNKLFILSYYTLLNIGLLVLSTKFNWADIRIASYSYITLFTLASIDLFNNAPSKLIPTMFLIATFIIFNIAPIIFSIKKKEAINQLDSLIIGMNALSFLTFLYLTYENVINNISEFGIMMLPVAFIYLIEMLYLKKIMKVKLDSSMVYSLLSPAILALNLSIFFILNKINVDFFLIVFIIEWIFFSLISKNIDIENKNYYQIISNLFLLLIGIWYLFVLRFDNGIVHASIYLGVLFSILIGYVYLMKKNINKDINGGLLLVSTFAFIYSLNKFFYFFIESRQVNEVLLSIMWLTYTLIGIKKLTDNKEAKFIMIGLLVITLLKIVFKDLMYLEGAARILGFIMFGVLLLIGSYFLKNEK